MTTRAKYTLEERKERHKKATAAWNKAHPEKMRSYHLKYIRTKALHDIITNAPEFKAFCKAEGLKIMCDG